MTLHFVRLTVGVHVVTILVHFILYAALALLVSCFVGFVGCMLLLFLFLFYCCLSSPHIFDNSFIIFFFFFIDILFFLESYQYGRTFSIVWF